MTPARRRSYLPGEQQAEEELLPSGKRRFSWRAGFGDVPQSRVLPVDNNQEREDRGLVDDFIMNRMPSVPNTLPAQETSQVAAVLSGAGPSGRASDATGTGTAGAGPNQQSREGEADALGDSSRSTAHADDDIISGGTPAVAVRAGANESSSSTATQEITATTEDVTPRSGQTPSLELTLGNTERPHLQLPAQGDGCSMPNSMDRFDSRHNATAEEEQVSIYSARTRASPLADRSLTKIFQSEEEREDHDHEPASVGSDQMLSPEAPLTAEQLRALTPLHDQYSDAMMDKMQREQEERVEGRAQQQDHLGPLEGAGAGRVGAGGQRVQVQPGTLLGPPRGGRASLISNISSTSVAATQQSKLAGAGGTTLSQQMLTRSVSRFLAGGGVASGAAHAISSMSAAPPARPPPEDWSSTTVVGGTGQAAPAQHQPPLTHDPFAGYFAPQDDSQPNRPPATAPHPNSMLDDRVHPFEEFNSVLANMRGRVDSVYEESSAPPMWAAAPPVAPSGVSIIYGPGGAAGGGPPAGGGEHRPALGVGATASAGAYSFGFGMQHQAQQAGFQHGGPAAPQYEYNRFNSRQQPLQQPYPPPPEFGGQPTPGGASGRLPYAAFSNAAGGNIHPYAPHQQQHPAGARQLSDIHEETPVQMLTPGVGVGRGSPSVEPQDYHAQVDRKSTRELIVEQVRAELQEQLLGNQKDFLRKIRDELDQKVFEKEKAIRDSASSGEEPEQLADRGNMKTNNDNYVRNVAGSPRSGSSAAPAGGAGLGPPAVAVSGGAGDGGGDAGADGRKRARVQMLAELLEMDVGDICPTEYANKVKALETMMKSMANRQRTLLNQIRHVQAAAGTTAGDSSAGAARTSDVGSSTSCSARGPGGAADDAVDQGKNSDPPSNANSALSVELTEGTSATTSRVGGAVHPQATGRGVPPHPAAGKNGKPSISERLAVQRKQRAMNNDEIKKRVGVSGRATGAIAKTSAQAAGARKSVSLQDGRFRWLNDEAPARWGATEEGNVFWMAPSTGRDYWRSVFWQDDGVGNARHAFTRQKCDGEAYLIGVKGGFTGYCLDYLLRVNRTGGIGGADGGEQGEMAVGTASASSPEAKTEDGPCHVQILCLDTTVELTAAKVRSGLTPRGQPPAFLDTRIASGKIAGVLDSSLDKDINSGELYEDEAFLLKSGLNKAPVVPSYLLHRGESLYGSAAAAAPSASGLLSSGSGAPVAGVSLNSGSAASFPELDQGLFLKTTSRCVGGVVRVKLECSAAGSLRGGPPHGFDVGRVANWGEGFGRKAFAKQVWKSSAWRAAGFHCLGSSRCLFRADNGGVETGKSNVLSCAPSSVSGTTVPPGMTIPTSAPGPAAPASVSFADVPEYKEQQASSSSTEELLPPAVVQHLPRSASKGGLKSGLNVIADAASMMLKPTCTSTTASSMANNSAAAAVPPGLDEAVVESNRNTITSNQLSHQSQLVVLPSSALSERTASRMGAVWSKSEDAAATQPPGSVGAGSGGKGSGAGIVVPRSYLHSPPASSSSTIYWNNLESTTVQAGTGTSTSSPRPLGRRFRENDQAGLLVYISQTAWLSVALVMGKNDEPAHISVVSCNSGASSSSSNIPNPPGLLSHAVTFRVEKRGTEFLVKAFDYREWQWVGLRFCHLYPEVLRVVGEQEEDEAKFGVFATTPDRYEEEHSLPGPDGVPCEMVARFHNFALDWS
eukprot:g10682.t1